MRGDCEKMKRKVMLFLSVILSMVIFSGCDTNKDSENTADVTVVSEKEQGDVSEVKKPEKIVLFPNTLKTDEAGMAEVCKQYEENTGIKLEVKQAEHNDYYESVNIAIATDEQIDCIEVGSVFYPSYAMYDLLWDMTDAWNKSELRGKVDETYVDNLKIDERLYGFPLTKGNGTVTYVRGDWLEKLGIDMPKNYSEFYSMLKKFKSMGEDIIPLTAAGFMNSETPYTIYMREFYQDAKPEFYKNDKGEYVDGMNEPEMKIALERMKQAYNDGLLDYDIATNKTSDCRNKFYEGKVGCFNYWAGTWNQTLDMTIKSDFSPTAEVIPLNPISEVKYIERPPLAMVIPKKCTNPEGVFKYLIEYSHDAGEGQMLFTAGVKDYHWRENSDGSRSEIEEHLYRGKAGAYFAQELAFNQFDTKIPIDKRIANSEELFMNNSEKAPIPVIAKETGGNMPEIDIIRREIIEEVVTTDMTVEEGIKQYNERCGTTVERVLKELNGK